MPAVSGSPTQIRSSVLTVLDLAGLPDDAYSAGDLAFVISVAQTFRLRRTALGSTPDGVTTVSTYTGNGYWEVFGGLPGAAISVANIAALSLLPDNTYGDGQQVFVESVRSFFSLRNGVVAPDGITIVAALSGAKTWFRNSMPIMWNAQVVFYLDGVAGNDENSGATALLPLRTLAELERRTYDPISRRTNDFTVNVIANVLNGDVFRSNVGVSFVGTLTALHSAVPLNAGGASVTNAVLTPAPCVMQAITCPAITFGIANLLKLSNDGGATFHYQGFATEDPALGAAQTLICQGIQLAAVLVNTDTIYEYTMPRVRAKFFSDAPVAPVPASSLTFRNLVLAGEFNDSLSVEFDGCVLGDDAALAPDDREVKFHNVNYIRCWVCKFVRSTELYSCPRVFLAGTTVSSGATIQAYNSHISLGADVIINDGDIVLSRDSILSMPTGNLGFSHFGAVSSDSSNTIINLATNGGAIWGLSPGATPVRLAKTNSVIIVSATSQFTNNGSYSHPNGAGGTVTALLATLPGAPSLVQMPNYNVGVIPDA